MVGGRRYVEKAQLEMDLAEAKKLIDRMSINADGAVPRADYEVRAQHMATPSFPRPHGVDDERLAVHYYGCGGR